MQVGVIGAGISGQAAAALLARKGARVLLSERDDLHLKPQKNIEIETGGHSLRLLDSRLIIRSPGVPSHLPILEKALRERIPVWSELELASRFIRPKIAIAITGTNGKTTTTTLVGKLFETAGAALVAGNIGTPLSACVDRIRSSTSVVLEASSYQLENIVSFHPGMSAILNITPDHLEHHGSMRAYIKAKARIFENQNRSDICVLNADDPNCRALAGECPAKVLFFSRKKALTEGIWHKDGRIYVAWGKTMALWNLRMRIPGPHNIENALAAAALAVAGGIPVDAIRKVLERFRGVEHRLEVVRSYHGARYINDSKATNVDSTRVALESFPGQVILIMGGQGKGSPYTPLKGLVKQRVKKIFLIGEDAGQIEHDLRGAAPAEQAGDMTRAVRRASQIAAEGDVVLLSPACASFDQYHDYEERGRHFKSLVKHL